MNNIRNEDQDLVTCQIAAGTVGCAAAEGLEAGTVFESLVAEEAAGIEAVRIFAESSPIVMEFAVRYYYIRPTLQAHMAELGGVADGTDGAGGTGKAERFQVDGFQQTTVLQS